MMNDAKNTDSLVPKLRFKGFTDDWTQRYLKDEVKFYSGQNYHPNDVVSDGTLVIRSSNVQNGEIVDADNVYINSNIVSTEQVRVNDIIVVVRNGSRSLIGKHAQITEKMPNTVIGAFMTGVRSSNSNFINSLFDSEWFKREVNKDLGSTINQITTSEFKKMRFKFPSDNERQQIGKLFFQLNKIIFIQQQKLDLLKQLKKGLLQEMFADNKRKIPSLRFKGFTSSWTQRKLGEVVKFFNGRAFKQQELLNSGKYRVLRVGNFYTNDKWYYSDLELTPDKYINNGDLVYTWSATFGPHIWKGNKVIYHYHIWKIDFDSKILNKEFLFNFLNFDKNNLLSNTNGSTMIHITKSNMEQKKISYPQISEQKRIGDLLNNINKIISIQQEKINKLQNIKQSLLQNMFI